MYVKASIENRKSNYSTSYLAKVQHILENYVI